MCPLSLKQLPHHFQAALSLRLCVIQSWIWHAIFLSIPPLPSQLWTSGRALLPFFISLWAPPWISSDFLLFPPLSSLFLRFVAFLQVLLILSLFWAVEGCFHWWIGPRGSWPAPCTWRTSAARSTHRGSRTWWRLLPPLRTYENRPQMTGLQRYHLIHHRNHLIFWTFFSWA